MNETKPKRKKQNRSSDSPSALKQKSGNYKVKKVGRPRITSLSEDEMIALGEEMLQWLKDHPGTVHLKEWYCIHKCFIYSEWKCFIQNEEFLPYYEKALGIISLKYLKKSVIRDGVALRFLRHYNLDLKETEDDDAEKEHLRKIETQNPIPPRDSEIDKENKNMEILAQKDKEIKELRVKLDNLTKAESQLS